MYINPKIMKTPTPEKLLYDAKFSGPRGAINPMGLKVPGLISVQLMPNWNATKWAIRNPDTNKPLTKLTFESPSLAMAHLPELFARQETDWEIRNMDGSPHEVEEEPAPEPKIYT